MEEELEVIEEVEIRGEQELEYESLFYRPPHSSFREYNRRKKTNRFRFSRTERGEAQEFNRFMENMAELNRIDQFHVQILSGGEVYFGYLSTFLSTFAEKLSDFTLILSPLLNLDKASITSINTILRYSKPKKFDIDLNQPSILRKTCLQLLANTGENSIQELAVHDGLSLQREKLCFAPLFYSNCIEKLRINLLGEKPMFEIKLLQMVKYKVTIDSLSTSSSHLLLLLRNCSSIDIFSVTSLVTPKAIFGLLLLRSPRTSVKVSNLMIPKRLKGNDEKTAKISQKDYPQLLDASNIIVKKYVNIKSMFRTRKVKMAEELYQKARFSYEASSW